MNILVNNNKTISQQMIHFIKGFILLFIFLTSSLFMLTSSASANELLQQQLNELKLENQKLRQTKKELEEAIAKQKLLIESNKTKIDTIKNQIATLLGKPLTPQTATQTATQSTPSTTPKAITAPAE